MSERRKVLGKIAGRYDVEIIYVFGSLSREVLGWIEEAGELLRSNRSDVDIGVLLPADVAWPAAEKVHFAQALEDFLGVGRVDLVILNEADPFLAAEIIRGERLYERDRRAADEYELYVFRRAGDLAPFEQERMRLILEGPR
jgi:predicted nucleotidyltransferase